MRQLALEFVAKHALFPFSRTWRSPMRCLSAPLIAALLTASQAAANPDEAPDIRALVESELGEGFRVVELALTAEELRRDGPDASYYGEFAASVTLPVAFYHEIGRGDGYLLVGKLLERGEIVPAFGNAVAAYRDGSWTFEINVLDLQLPGGRPFSEFRSPGTVVLEAGTDLVDRFQTQREVALRDAEALRIQDIRIEDAETAALLARRRGTRRVPGASARGTRAVGDHRGGDRGHATCPWRKLARHSSSRRSPRRRLRRCSPVPWPTSRRVPTAGPRPGRRRGARRVPDGSLRSA